MPTISAADVEELRSSRQYVDLLSDCATTTGGSFSQNCVSLSWRHHFAGMREANLCAGEDWAREAQRAMDERSPLIGG